MSAIRAINRCHALPSLFAGLGLLSMSVMADGVVGLHRWYEHTSPDPIVSVSVYASLDACRAALRGDVRQQQAEWEAAKDSYRFRFSAHGCFDTGAGISDDAGQFWVPQDEMFWVNPTFISEQCRAAGGDDRVCGQVTTEFIEANRNGDATGEIPPPGLD